MLRPKWTSKPSTPRNRRSALRRRRILAQGSAGEDDLDGRARKFGRDIDGVGDDREVVEVAQTPGDGAGSCAGIENDDLTLLDLRGRAFGDA